MTQSVERPYGGTEEAAQAPEQLVQEYLAALRDHQLEKCVSLFTDDATIEFQSGVFKGPSGITEWHRDRFAAGFQILDVERLTVEGNIVTIEAAITSARLRGWKINKLSGKATISIENGRITSAVLAPKMYNPFEGW